MLAEGSPGNWRDDAAFCGLIDWYMALNAVDDQLESNLSVWLANEISTRFDKVLTANLVAKAGEGSSRDATARGVVKSKSTRENTYLSPAEVASRLVVTIKTLANWRSKKTGPPFHKFRSRVLYVADGLEQWMSDNSPRPQ